MDIDGSLSPYVKSSIAEPMLQRKKKTPEE